MDFFLMLIIILTLFFIIRTYLRGAIVGIIDVFMLSASTFIAVILHNNLSFFMYTTGIYKNSREAITSMMNYNSIMSNGTEHFEVIPNVIFNFTKSNIPDVVLENASNSIYEEYLIDILSHLVVATETFLLVFATCYFLLHILRVIIMPAITIVEFGIPDKIISIIIGLIKSILIIFIVLAIIPILLVEFNYENVFNVITNSPILSFFYNIDPIIKSLLNSIYIG